MPPFFCRLFLPLRSPRSLPSNGILHLLGRTGEQVGVPPLGGFVCKAFPTRPPKGGTPTLGNAIRSTSSLHDMGKG